MDVAFVTDEFTGIGFEDVKLFVRLLVNPPPRHTATYVQYKKISTLIKTRSFVEEILNTGIEIV